MSQFRPLHELAAEKLVAQIRAQNSIFHGAGEGSSPMAAFNPLTGKTYRGISALYLNLQPYNDPRWLTLKQAGLMKAKIPKGSSATRIVFYKTTERMPLTGDQGQPKLSPEGKKMYRTVNLDQGVNETAWVFNAEQLKGMPALEKSVEKHSKRPDDSSGKVLNILHASGAKMQYGGNEAYYDLGSDTLHFPDKNKFARPSQFDSVAIYELAHRAVQQQERLRTSSGVPDPQTKEVREEIKAAITSAILYRQLGIAEPLPALQHHMEFWADFLEKNPFELQLATIDAQKAIDVLMAYGSNSADRKKSESLPKGLFQGDKISHDGQRYEIGNKLRGNGVQALNLDTGANLKLKPGDGLYQSLVEAKFNRQNAVITETAISPEVQSTSRNGMRR